MKTLTSTIVKIIANNVTFDWFKPYKTDQESESIGTGFFIDKEGYIVTCAHVVVDAIKLFITIPSIGKERIDVEVVGICDHSDLALLKTVTYKPEHCMTLGDSDGIVAGTKVIAIGYPLGQDRLKQTSGIISGRQDSNFQTDSPINPGNSGGPLVNEQFEVIGVNSSKIMFADNIGYAKPIYQFKILEPAMRKLLGSDLKDKMIFKPGLFANFNNTSDDLIKYYGSVSGCKSGYYIKKIHPKSPLIKSNIKAGDIICGFGKQGEVYEVDNYGECEVSWNSEKVHIYDIMQRYILEDQIIIKYWRKDKSEVQQAVINLGDMVVPQIRLYYRNYDDIDYVVFGGLIVMELTGNHLNSLFNMDITRKMADHLSMYAHLKNKYEKVLIITQIFPGSHLTKVESLNQGDILTKVNNIKVSTLDDYREALLQVKEINNEFYIKFETKLCTLAVCNLKTLLNEEAFLSESFKYPIDPICNQFNQRYPNLMEETKHPKQSKHVVQEESTMYGNPLDILKLLHSKKADPISEVEIIDQFQKLEQGYDSDTEVPKYKIRECRKNEKLSQVIHDQEVQDNLQKHIKSRRRRRY